MRIIKKVFYVLCIVAVLIGLTGCSNNKFSEKETKYYVVYSDIFNTKGAICGIDEDGNYTSSQKIKLQDGTRTKLIDGKTIVGCQRSNNHVLVDEKGNYNEFYLLDTPKYTGVCAMTFNDDKVISSMNVGFSEGVYENLLVVQDWSGNIEVKEVIELYAEDIICIDNTVYVVGCMDYAGEDDGWIGKIISYDLDSGEMAEAQFESGKPLADIQCINNQIFCSVRTVNDGCYEIYVIDRVTLEKTDSFIFKEKINGLVAINESLYCEIGGKICQIDTADGSIIISLYDLPEGSYLENLAASRDKLYITSRLETPVNGENNPLVGTIAEYSFSEETCTETSIYMNRKKYSFFVVCPIN